jgi:general stress protein CsbA
MTALRLRCSLPTLTFAWFSAVLPVFFFVIIMLLSRVSRQRRVAHKSLVVVSVASSSQGSAHDTPLLFLGQVLDRLPLKVQRLDAASLLLFTFPVLFHFSSFVRAYANHHLSPF